MSIIKNLALSGGGVYGYSLISCIEELEKYTDLINIQSICGSSVGALVGSLYAVGYSANELEKIMFELNFEELIKDSSIPYLSLYERYGMYEGKKLEGVIERLIEEKTGRKLCTFSQIDKDLTVVATNINLQKPIYFNKITSPRLSISLAIRMSIAYPIILTPILYEGDLHNDGGDCINYPISYFSNMDETIGIAFISHNENKDGSLKSKVDIRNLTDYITSIGSTLSRSAYISQLDEKYVKRTIFVQIDEPISSTQFNISEAQKRNIYEAGKLAVKNQIDKILNHK